MMVHSENTKLASSGVFPGEFAGLTNEQVTHAREQYGTNVLTKRKGKSFFKSFLTNFGDPMIRVLLVALGIQIVFLFGNSQLIETFGIATAILVAVIVSTISEYGSEKAFEKLQAVAGDIECRIRRSGRTISAAVADVVVGDIVLLGAGDKIPADGIIIQGNIEVDQSLLNGESKEARKLVGANSGTTKIQDKAQGKIDFLDPNLLFSGTVVTNGEAIMRVTSVGDNTVYGKIAAELQEATPISPLKVKLERLAKMISLIGYIGAGLVAVSYMFSVLVIQNGFDWGLAWAQITNFKIISKHLINAATLVVSVIVMAVPEGLPMMITVVLSSNMKHMLKDNVLIRKLGGIETAGSMNILFTDKTGTLTHGKLEVVGLVHGDGSYYEINEKKKIPNSELNKLLSLSLRNNTAAEISKGRAIGGNSTDRILLEFAQSLPEPNGDIKKLSSIPFSSANKFMSTTVNSEGTSFTLIKGAPEKLLLACTKHYNKAGEIENLDDKSEIYKKLDELSSQAIRLIAVAVDFENKFDNLVLVGLIAIRDRARTESITSIAQLRSAGIQTVMITGDSRDTATAIAREVGILSKNDKRKINSDGKVESELVLTSDEMIKMTDKQLAEALPRLRVVARALPSDKSRLVRIAQSLNLVTGMTGDGVNDAPALKKADIGFAMGSGTEVAKEAGDIVIMDDNINSIARAVSYGRTIFKSIRKFLIFKLTINFCAMAICIIAPLLSVDTPITVIQMLWINLVMDTLAGLAFGGEKPRANYMTEPPKKRDEPIINRYMWQQIIVASIFTALVSLWFLISPTVQNHFDARGDAYSMTAFFMFFMFLNIFNSFNARTHDLNPLSHINLNKPFIWIMGVVSIVQVSMIFFGGAIFRTVPLSFVDFIVVILLALTVIPADMLRKLIVNRKGVVAGT